ncbi:MAG: GntR family transcriptional regulator [Thermomicrobiales bacterium]
MKKRPRFQTKQELVYSALYEAIMDCTLAPGERLIIDDISRQLEVSHIPVREAISQLQSERLVFIVPHSGATVSPITRESIHEVFVLMEGLELVSMEIATARLSPADFDRLEQLLAEMDAAIDAGEVEQWSHLNATFHREITAATAMPRVIEMLGRTLDHWDRIRRYFGITPGRLAEAQAEHHEILAALVSHDVEHLRTLARQHSRRALEAYMLELDTNPAVTLTASSTGGSARLYRESREE